LKKYDGSNGEKSFIGCNGWAFDVTGAEMYTKGGPYGLFAGRDASVALAKMSFEENDLESSDVSKLNYDQKDTLEQWELRFRMKYRIAGRISDGAKLD
jgi:membrane-associated progesterone receptor component